MAGHSAGQMKAWGLAMDLVYGVVGGAVVGYLLDRFVFGTTPWLTFGLSVVMVVGGMIRFIRAANRLNRGFSADARAGRFGTEESWAGDEAPEEAED